MKSKSKMASAVPWMNDGGCWVTLLSAAKALNVVISLIVNSY